MERNPLNLMFFALVLTLMLGSTMAMAENDSHLKGMEISADKAELAVGGKPVNLYGVHFPPESELCGETAGECLARALTVLDHWIDDQHEVHCRVLAVAASGTHFAECHFGENEIGRWLVANGFALADRQVTRRYIREEQEARRAGLGIWKDFGTGFSMVR